MQQHSESRPPRPTDRPQTPQLDIVSSSSSGSSMHPQRQRTARPTSNGYGHGHGYVSSPLNNPGTSEPTSPQVTQGIATINTHETHVAQLAGDVLLSRDSVDTLGSWCESPMDSNMDSPSMKPLLGRNSHLTSRPETPTPTTGQPWSASVNDRIRCSSRGRRRVCSAGAETLSADECISANSHNSHNSNRFQQDYSVVSPCEWEDLPYLGPVQGSGRCLSRSSRSPTGDSEHLSMASSPSRTSSSFTRLRNFVSFGNSHNGKTAAGDDNLCNFLVNKRSESSLGNDYSAGSSTDDDSQTSANNVRLLHRHSTTEKTRKTNKYHRSSRCRNICLALLVLLSLVIGSMVIEIFYTRRQLERYGKDSLGLHSTQYGFFRRIYDIRTKMTNSVLNSYHKGAFEIVSGVKTSYSSNSNESTLRTAYNELPKFERSLRDEYSRFLTLSEERFPSKFTDETIQKYLDDEALQRKDYQNMESLPYATYDELDFFLNNNPVTTVSLYKSICIDFDWLAKENSFYVSEKTNLARLVRRYGFCFLSHESEAYLKHFKEFAAKQFDIESLLFPWYKHTPLRFEHAHSTKENYRLMTLSEYRKVLDLKKRGLVVSVGKKHILYLKGLLTNLRQIGNRYPLEIFHSSTIDSEMEREFRKIVKGQFELIFRISELTLTESFETTTMWFCFKLISLASSSFTELILIDADTVILSPTEDLFEEELYKNNGLYLFRDRRVEREMPSILRELLLKMLPWDEGVLTDPEFENNIRSIESKQGMSHKNKFKFDLSETKKQVQYDREPFVKDKITLKELEWNGLGRDRYHTAETGLVIVNKQQHFLGMMMGVNMMYIREVMELLREGDKEVFWIAPLVMGDTKIGMNKYHSVAAGTPIPSDITSGIRKEMMKNPSFDDKLKGSDFDVICTTHPSHIDNEGTKLLWINSGFEKCKFDMYDETKRLDVDSRVMNISMVLAIEEENQYNWNSVADYIDDTEKCRNYAWCGTRWHSETTPKMAISQPRQRDILEMSRAWIQATLE